MSRQVLSVNRSVCILKEYCIPYELNVDLKKRTWIHRGGICLLWIEPLTIEQLKVIVSHFYSEKIHFEIVGHTSNLYFLNDYNPVFVISTRKLKSYRNFDGCIVCECGVSMKSLAKYCVENGYEGFEGLIDLPGTVGAAVYNNAGCYNCSISDILLRIEYIDGSGNICCLTKEELEYSTRSSILKREKGGNQKVILFVYLEKKIAIDKNLLKSAAIENARHRRMNQESPSLNLGSTYAEISYKTIPLLLMKIISLFCFICNRRGKLLKYIKEMLLFIYGYKRLSVYISDYSLHCFIWRDENADFYFVEYMKFIDCISVSRSLEIEIKNDIIGKITK